MLKASEIEVDSAIETHLIVTPARSEAENLGRTGQRLVEPTWRPDAWIVVDNGSTHGTQDVVRELGGMPGPAAAAGSGIQLGPG